ncbi:MAG: V-type ATPase subunit a family protein [Butyrivibrio sp.]|nr:V-type ATPase subunit a family protein [Butyrivibrio sp.]
MDRIGDFLNKVQENYKYEMLSVEQNLERLNLQINDYNKTISEIEASIDNSYSVMSASGSVNEEKNAELSALEELLKTHKKELSEQENKRSALEKNMAELKELIELYKKQEQVFGSISREEIVAKLDFISKLVKVDSFRAIEEIEALKTILLS